MRRHKEPIDDKATRILNIRTRLYEIHHIRRSRDLTLAEETEYERLNEELQKLTSE
jgi:hypothetical protein